MSCLVYSYYKCIWCIIYLAFHICSTDQLVMWWMCVWVSMCLLFLSSLVSCVAVVHLCRGVGSWPLLGWGVWGFFMGGPHNSLSLNFDKTYFLQFRPKNSYEINIKISCDKLIKETKNTKFIGLYIDSSLSWKTHIDQMMIKLNRACHAIRYVKHFMSQYTLRTIYFSYFHCILSYGIIFWGNSAYSSNIFKIQKRIIRIIMNARNRDSCRQLIKNLKILPLKSQYVSPLLLFVAKNRDSYE